MERDVREQLAGWVEAGLIQPAQAEAILDHEGGAEAGDDDGGSRSLVAEVIGYVGAALAVVAAGILLGEFWDRIRTWAQVLLLAVTTGALLLAGAVLRGREDDPAVRRLVDVLWLAGVVGVGFTVGVASDRGFPEIDEGTAAVVYGITALAAAGLLALRQRPLQNLPVPLLIATTAASAVATQPVADGAVWGAVLAGTGLAWVLLTAGGLVGPPRTGTVAGLLLLGVGLQVAAVEGREAVALVIALLGCAALLWLSVRGRSTLLAGLAMAGVFLFTPQAVSHFLGDSLGAPLLLLVTGLLLVGASLGVLQVREEITGAAS